MKIRRALPLLAVLTVMCGRAAAQPLSPEQALNRHALGKLEFSPDGAPTQP